MNKNRKKSWRWVAACIVLIVTIMGASSGSYATYYYAARVGCKLNSAIDAYSNPVSAGNTINYIYTGDTGAGNYVAPNEAGTIVATADVGYDTVDFTFPPPTTNGKFWNWCQSPPQVSTQTSFFARVWSGDPSNPSSMYGESNMFSPAFNASGPVPAQSIPNIELSNVNVVLAQAAPDTPTIISSSCLQGGSGGQPTLSLTYNFKVNTRYYEFQADTDPGFGSSAPDHYSSGTVWRGSRQATTGDTSIGWSSGLGGYGDNKTWYFRVKAGNTYGESAWSTPGNIFAPPNLNNSVPSAVTDLRLVSSGPDSITLQWTAPNVLDSHGIPTSVNSYEVKSWDNTYYDSNFYTNGVPYTSPGTPVYYPVTPPVGGSTQILTIEGVLPGLYNFMLISFSTSGIASDLSNMAAAKVGSGETVIVAKNADDLFISLEANGDVNLTWEAIGANTCEVLASTTFNGPYSVITTTDVQPFHYTDPDPGTKYYQVRVKGGGYAPMVAGKMVYTFAKTSGSTNVHTFSIPFDTSTNASNDPVPDLSTSTGVRNSIQQQNSGSSIIVDYIGKWNAATQTSTAELNSGLGTPFPINIGEAYQISISPEGSSATWAIVGTR